MIITQTIIDNLISGINLEWKNLTGENVNGSGIAVKDTSGQVVEMKVSENGSRNYIGIDDSKNSYFYIRLNGTQTESRKAGNVKRGSCGLEMEVRTPLKLVFQHRCSDPRLLLDAVKFALFNVNLKSIKWDYDILNIRLFPATSEVLSWIVYATETGKEPKTLNSLLQIISIDFELRYDLTYNEKCKPFNIC
jgi:hypothetical protein